MKRTSILPGKRHKMKFILFESQEPSLCCSALVLIYGDVQNQPDEQVLPNSRSLNQLLSMKE